MSRFTIILAAALTLTVSSVSAQNRENVEQVGRIYNQWDHAWNVVVEGDYAFVAAGVSGLQILDISDPENPEVVGYWDDNPGEAKCVFVVGDFAYVADAGSGLRVIDVSDPENPDEVGFYDTPGSAYGVFVVGDFAYVADAGSGLRVIDVSDPENPDEVGFYETPRSAYCVFVSGDFAYVAAETAGLRVIDVSDPENPDEVGFYDTPGAALGVFVVGDLAYVADQLEGLRVIDVSDPENPDEIGFYDTPGYAWGVFVAGDLAYVTDFGRGLRVIDVSDPENPDEVGFYDTPGYAYGVFVYADFAYVAYGDGCLRVIDVSDPENPDEVGLYDTPGRAWGVFVVGDFAYVAYGDEGLSVIDVTDPENPDEVGFYDTPGNAYGVFVVGDFAYVADYSSGLRVIDVSDPENPDEVGFYDTPGNARGVFIAGDFAYVTDTESGLRVIDVSDPENPDEVGFYDTPGYAWGVFVAGDFAYVADYTAGLRVIDVSDPENPDEVGSYNTPGDAWGVFVAGDLAYVADGDRGLRVIDVSDPENPDEVGFYDTPGSAAGVFVAGDLAYVADGGSGLRVIDVSDPENPDEVGFYDTPGWAYDLFVSEGLIYVADFTNVGIYRFTGGEEEIPSIAVEPDALDFGEVNAGGSGDLTLTISNTGDADLTVSDISVAGEYFSIDFEGEFTVGPDTSHNVVVTFAPEEAGEFEGALTITSNDPDNEEISVRLTGIGVEVNNVVDHIQLVSGTRQLTAGSGDTTWVRATSYYEDGSPVDAGTEVHFEAYIGRFVDEIVAVTGNQGIAWTYYIAGNRVGTDTLIAWIPEGEYNIYSNQVLIDLVSGSPTRISLRAEPDELNINDPDAFSTITATVTDTADNPVLGIYVTFITTIGSITPSAVTDDDGEAEARLTPGEQAGVAEVSASAQSGEDRIFSNMVEVRFVEGEPVEGHVLYVPDDFETIQAAIDTSQDGDTVVVRQGRYVENINFSGKNIVVASLFLTTGDEDYIEETVIDGDENGTVVTFENGETEDAMLIGFTIQNGQNEHGAGIYCNTTSPTINNCIITNNRTEGSGGGIRCWNSRSLINNCSFSNNLAGYGGGIDVNSGSETTIINCTFVNNEASGNGGGIHCGYSTLHLNDSYIIENSAGLHGGGIWCGGSTSYIQNCTISDNSASWHGGGIGLSGSEHILRFCSIAGNSAGAEGGGISLLSSANLSIVNCTFSRNHTERNGGGISLKEGSEATTLNTIFWNNDPEEVSFLADEEQNTFTILYSDISGGEDAIVTNDNGEVNWGEGNIDADPQFADPDNGDFHLTADSPCIDAGDPESPDDPDGTRADMGAFYFDQDEEDELEIREVGYYDTPGSAIGVFVAGDFAYVADMESGLRVIDVSDPENPDEVGFYDTPGIAIGVFVAGDFAYVADYEAGLRVIDITDPESPDEVGFYDTPGYAMGVFVAGDLAYVADYTEGLRVIDVSDPENPDEVGYYDTPGYAHGVFVAGDLAYVAGWESGLRVIDVSDPENPDEVGFYDTPGWATGVFAAGDVAYVADWEEGLRVIDVSDPENPDEVGFYDTPGVAYGVFVAGDLAYVADDGRGLRVIDVSDPENPDEVGFYDTPGLAEGVFVAGDLAYVGDRESGLRILDVSDFFEEDIPQIAVDPETLDFGEVRVGEREELMLTISNEGDADLIVSDISVAGEYFSFDFEGEFTVGPDTSRDVIVTFAPEEAGEFEGFLRVVSNDADDGEARVQMIGIGVEPQEDHEPPELLWSQTYGGEGTDECQVVIQTADGGFALAGDSESFGAGREDFWLVKADENGDSLWSRTYGGEDWDGCNSVIQTADSGFALAGYTESFGEGGVDFWLIRTDENGDSLWSRTYGGEGTDECQVVIQTADGGFALAGNTESFGAGSREFWLVKTDENGDSLWSRTYGGESYERCESIIQTVDGGFALAGSTHSFGAGGIDFWLIKTDENGDSLWSRTYGNELYNNCYTMIQTADGGFALVGLIGTVEAQTWDFWIVRTNENGDSLWSRTYGGEGLDVCFSIIQNADGGFFLEGIASSLGAEGQSCLIRTNEHGDSLWSRTYGGEDGGCGFSIIQTADGGFALAGYTTSFGAGDADFWLIRLGPEEEMEDETPTITYYLYFGTYIPGFGPGPDFRITILGEEVAEGEVFTIPSYDLGDYDLGESFQVYMDALAGMTVLVEEGALTEDIEVHLIIDNLIVIGGGDDPYELVGVYSPDEDLQGLLWMFADFQVWSTDPDSVQLNAEGDFHFENDARMIVNTPLDDEFWAMMAMLQLDYNDLDAAYWIGELQQWEGYGIESVMFEFNEGFWFGVALEHLAFVGNGPQGGFDGQDCVVSLMQGWNLISLNVVPGQEFFADGEDPGPDVVLMTEQLRIDGNNHHIIILKDDMGRFYVPEADWHNIPFWSLQDGYMVKVDADVEASWNGISIPADTDVFLPEGWNFIPYYPTYDLPASDPDFYVLSPIIDHVWIAKQIDGRFMVPEWDYSNMPPWRATQGYQVKVDEDVVLNYPPEPDGDALSMADLNRPERQPGAGRRGVSMSLLVQKFAGLEAGEDSRVEVLSTEGMVAGEGIIDADGRCGLAVWADDPLTGDKDGLAEGEAFALVLIDGDERIPLQAGRVLAGEGLVFSSNGLAVVEMTASTIPEDYYLSDVFPNPFNSLTRISYGVPERSHVALQVYDIAGRLTATLMDGEMNAGRHTVTFDGVDLPSGIYIVSMRTRGFSQSRKAVMLK